MNFSTFPSGQPTETPLWGVNLPCPPYRGPWQKTFFRNKMKKTFWDVHTKTLNSADLVGNGLLASLAVARAALDAAPHWVWAKQPSKSRGSANSLQRSRGCLHCDRNLARGDGTASLRQSHRAHPATKGSETHAQTCPRYIATTLSFWFFCCAPGARWR